MPTATTAKSAMAGVKRKSAPVNNSHVKESKKPKVDSDMKSALKAKSKPPPVKIEESNDEDSEDSDSDGGVPLDYESGGSEGVNEIVAKEHEEEQSDSEELPKAADGLHPERARAVIVNSQSSKEAHAKQKQLAQERKAAKPLAEQLVRTKKIWERLRRKSHVPVDERKLLVTELFEIITGRIKDFVLKHDSVRVVQTAIKYANPEQRLLIAGELSGTYRQLAESRYAKFLIGKLLVQGDDKIRDIIVPEFFGNVRRLIKHPEASWILDDVYRGVASRQQKATILREWYGAEFALFEKDNTEKVSGDLADILAANPGKRGPIMRSLQELINHLIQKKMTGFTLLHDAMLQYFLNIKPGTEEITDYLELIKGDEEGDLLKNLAFTRSGSRVVCLALAYGTAKDRKQILRTYKDTLQLMAADPNGHIVILAAYEVIDDTILTSKSIFPELLTKDAEKQVENIVFSANDINSRTTLLYLFQGRSKALFPANLAADIEILEEIDTIRSTTSKKDPELRRSELAKALSPFLLKTIESAAGDLVASSFGCQFVTEVLFGAEGDKSASLHAVAETAAGDPNHLQPAVTGEGTEEVQTPSHIAMTPWGGKMLKALIAGGRYDIKTKTVVPVEPALNFADILYPIIEDQIMDWATGSSSFVVLALTEANNFSKKDGLMELLRDGKKRLQKAAKDETTEQKSRRETATAEKDVGKSKGEKSKTVKIIEVGNKGSALLLEKL
ncbi:ARM repeat-containing protein [Hyaloscypha variabilis F]|uniref:ARM repeat-containing protein n=1 Tax=Hyaloscypha variabilis (strain UAMH 11265 / GT02V1 / F) TaxID=1149755 RepID=A0A2J6SCY5_HYAVF|nr:ARM repeat-containing protein [Hyaloscypha variabilis F]